jgi:hypothetical protein
MLVGEMKGYWVFASNSAVPLKKPQNCGYPQKRNFSQSALKSRGMELFESLSGHYQPMNNSKLKGDAWNRFENFRPDLSLEKCRAGV